MKKDYVFGYEIFFTDNVEDEFIEKFKYAIKQIIPGEDPIQYTEILLPLCEKYGYIYSIVPWPGNSHFIIQSKT